jgi:hypothetical protein
LLVAVVVVVLVISKQVAVVALGDIYLVLVLLF